jgi:signal transduction histidine kinase
MGDIMRAFDAMVHHTAEITEQLEEERARAVAASKAKSDFLANMSHELRTPLNAIIGFSELLLEPLFGELSEKQRSYVNDILDSGKHLLALINDILDLAKIEAGKMELEPRPVDLRLLVSSSIRLISERASKQLVELSSEIEEELTSVTADARKLKQLMFNLLSNAVKFTPAGGRVGVRTWREESGVIICVWDTGIGVPESERTKIFEDFYQVGNSTVRAQQGTGLGLSLVKKIAELHGGRVWVESEVDVGSKFFVQLPQKQRSEEAKETQLVVSSA